MTTAHSSQANGKQERLNLTIANLFRTLLSDNSLPETFWSTLVPLVQLMINATPAKSVNWLAPMQAFLNLKPMRPIDFFLDGNKQWRTVDITKPELKAYIAEFQEATRAREVQLHELQEQRSLALRNAQARKVHPKVLTVQIGDYVMVRNRKQMLAKLERRWRGPARVVEIADTKLEVTVEYLGERGRHRRRETVHAKDVSAFDIATILVTQEIKHHATMSTDATFQVRRLVRLGKNQKGSQQRPSDRGGVGCGT